MAHNVTEKFGDSLERQITQGSGVLIPSPQQVRASEPRAGEAAAGNVAGKTLGAARSPLGWRS